MEDNIADMKIYVTIIICLGSSYNVYIAIHISKFFSNLYLYHVQKHNLQKICMYHRSNPCTLDCNTHHRCSYPLASFLFQHFAST